MLVLADIKILHDGWPPPPGQAPWGRFCWSVRTVHVGHGWPVGDHPFSAAGALRQNTEPIRANKIPLHSIWQFVQQSSELAQPRSTSGDKLVGNDLTDFCFGCSIGSPPLVCKRKRVNSSGLFSILNLLSSTRRTCDVVMELLMRTFVTEPNAGVKTAVW